MLYAPHMGSLTKCMKVELDQLSTYHTGEHNPTQINKNLIFTISVNPF